MDSTKRVAGTGHFPPYDPPKWDRPPDVWRNPKVPLAMWFAGIVVVLLLVNRR